MSEDKKAAMQVVREMLEYCPISEQEIPSIALYVEQVTALLDEQMGAFLRRDDEDVFTKTMINNYTKAGLLPRPVKKKYDRSHIEILAYIFLLKSIISVQDIDTLFSLAPNDDKAKIYRDFTAILDATRKESLSRLQEYDGQFASLLDKMGIADKNERRMMEISMLAYEALLCKMACARLLDDIAQENRETETK